MGSRLILDDEFTKIRLALETFAVGGAVEDKALLQLARSVGVAVIVATGQDQVATEFRKLGPGVFTYALM